MTPQRIQLSRRNDETPHLPCPATHLSCGNGRIGAMGTSVIPRQSAPVFVSRHAVCDECGTVLSLVTYGVAGPRMGGITCGACVSTRKPAKKTCRCCRDTEPYVPPQIKAAEVAALIVSPEAVKVKAVKPGKPQRPGPPPDRTTCWTRKERHETELAAQQMLSWWRKTKRKSQNRMRHYECTYCQGWHLTHLTEFKPKRESNRLGAWV